MTKLIQALVAAAIAVCLAASLASTASATDDDGRLAGLSPSEKALAESRDPVVVTIDSTSGSVLAVEPRAESEVSPMATTTCNGTRPCWNPYIGGTGIGFTGTDTRGSWSNRCGFHTGNREANITWSFNGGANQSSGWWGKHTHIVLQPCAVVGKRVRLAG